VSNKIINNSVSHNSDGAGGGGISALATTGTVHLNVLGNFIKDNMVMVNASKLAIGGGIHFEYAEGKLIGNVIINNSVVNSAYPARGGGVHLWGPATQPVIFKDNVVSNNLADGHDINPNYGYGALGGGLVTGYTNVLILNNVISHNKISATHNAAGAGISIALLSSITKINNNIHDGEIPSLRLTYE